MKAWGFYLPHLEALTPRLREMSADIRDVIASNPGASIDMAGEMQRTANELVALANLINEASRTHAKTAIKGR